MIEEVWDLIKEDTIKSQLCEELFTKMKPDKDVCEAMCPVETLIISDTRKLDKHNKPRRYIVAILYLED